LSVITLPGVYSVIVPPPSVVVVVVVVLEVCAQANGATNASAMLSTVFFIFISFPLNNPRGRFESFSLEKVRPLSDDSDGKRDLVPGSKHFLSPAPRFPNSHNCHAAAICS
jgi:hypothetical protein